MNSPCILHYIWGKKRFYKDKTMYMTGTNIYELKIHMDCVNQRTTD